MFIFFCPKADATTAATHSGSNDDLSCILDTAGIRPTASRTGSHIDGHAHYIPLGDVVCFNTLAYLTPLDAFIVGASVLVFAGLATAVAVSYVFNRCRIASAEKLNSSARSLSPLLLASLAFGAFYI